ncbi:hypothetical protein Leryth_018401 [Lithospermum erythrorhizon]|nr:hypothetical protein Leryth_018401 [Lithospermum erythrorhizon]
MPTKALMEAELKVCFNSKCRKAMEQPKNGWRCRSGQFAQLCHPCASAYVEGKFCETFHSNLPGWRFCETCGKQIHCGCIVSFHLFVLLDTGGIECLLCTRKSFILQPNPAWPQPSLCLPSHPEGIKDLPAKNYSPVAGSGPVPWLQAPKLFNGSSITSERQANASSEIDVLDSSHIRLADQRSACSLNFERNDNSVELLLSGSTGLSCGLVKGNPVVHGDHNNSSVHGSHHSNSSKSDPSFQNTDVALVYSSYTSVNKIDNANNKTATTRRSPTMSTTFNGNGSSHNSLDTSTNLKVCGVNVKGDGQGRSQLLTQYSSPTTDQLPRIPEANCVLTPLFEKTLSASDAGKIGRLVLPKKCAEAYLPQISHSEGLPLEVLDAKGNKWVFQFRFWPNNNSRMYVLEGITPCLQALQLHAGDIVTFGRLEPEGKLVVGCRKASISSSLDQGNEAITTGGGISAKRENKIKEETTMKRRKRDEVNIITSRPAISGCGLTTVGRVKENTVNRIKRKGSTLASRHKHMRIDSGNLVELKITCSQAQGFLRPPPDAIPKIIIIEGFEFEEYEVLALHFIFYF